MTKDYTKKYTVKDITGIVGGILTGDDYLVIEKLLPPSLADEKTLALALSEEEIENLVTTKAKAALVPIGVTMDNITTIEVERPRLAMMKLLHLFYIAPDAPAGIHPTAVVHPTAKLGENVSIGPNVVIGRDVEIGDNSKFIANVYVGKSSKIGSNCLFHPNVSIGDFILIGNNVIIHHGASIGADGFSFVTENPSNIETAKESGKIEVNAAEHKVYKIPSIGSVSIGDDVEIGANATVDRGTIENTIIGKNTKIDNLVMVGHNCKVGEACLIVSQVGVAGSSIVGNRVVLAGQVGLADHVKIGDDSIVMAQSGVSKSFPEKSIVMGTPAVPRKEFVKQMKSTRSYETLMNELKTLKKEVEELKKR